MKAQGWTKLLDVLDGPGRPYHQTPRGSEGLRGSERQAKPDHALASAFPTRRHHRAPSTDPIPSVQICQGSVKQKCTFSPYLLTRRQVLPTRLLLSSQLPCLQTRQRIMEQLATLACSARQWCQHVLVTTASRLTLCTNCTCNGQITGQLRRRESGWTWTSTRLQIMMFHLFRRMWEKDNSLENDSFLLNQSTILAKIITKYFPETFWIVKTILVFCWQMQSVFATIAKLIALKK